MAVERGLKAQIDEMVLDDLKLIDEWVTSAIKKRKDEKKIPLWVVSDSWMNYAAVPEDRYEKAVDIARTVLDRKKDQPGNIEIEITKHRFLESDAAEMLELWQEPANKGGGKA